MAKKVDDPMYQLLSPIQRNDSRRDIYEVLYHVFQLLGQIKEKIGGDVDNISDIIGGGSGDVGHTHSHNNLSDLQGGASSQYYHLTNALHDEVANFFNNTNISGAEAEQLTDGSRADNLHEHDLGTRDYFENETFIVQADKQHIVHNKLTLDTDAKIVINGRLVII